MGKEKPAGVAPVNSEEVELPKIKGQNCLKRCLDSPLLKVLTYKQQEIQKK